MVQFSRQVTEVDHLNLQIQYMSKIFAVVQQRENVGNSKYVF